MTTGIKIKDIKIGNGEVAEKKKIAILHYDCYLNKGEKIDTSRNKNSLQLEIGQRNHYIGIEQGVIGMRVGGIRRVTVSPHLTYYEQKNIPNIPQNAVLIYEIELLNISDEWDNYWIDKYKTSKFNISQQIIVGTGIVFLVYLYFAWSSGDWLTKISDREFYMSFAASLIAIVFLVIVFRNKKRAS